MRLQQTIPERNVGTSGRADDGMPGCLDAGMPRHGHAGMSGRDDETWACWNNGGTGCVAGTWGRWDVGMSGGLDAGTSTSGRLDDGLTGRRDASPGHGDAWTRDDEIPGRVARTGRWDDGMPDDLHNTDAKLR